MGKRPKAHSLTSVAIVILTFAPLFAAPDVLADASDAVLEQGRQQVDEPSRQNPVLSQRGTGLEKGKTIQAETATDDPASGTTAVAAEEIALEHGKINTADASPVAPGHYEIESSFSYTRATRFWDTSGHSHDRYPFQGENIGLFVTAGLFENADISVSGSYSWLRDDGNNFGGGTRVAEPITEHDFTDTELRGRYRFYNNEHLEIAYMAGVSIPTGSNSDGDGISSSQKFWSFNQMLVATKDWQRLTLNGDIGFTLPIAGKKENARGALNLDLAMGYHILPWLQAEVELNYSHNSMQNEDDAQTLAITAGLVMPVNETLRVNIGVQQDVWGENTDKTMTTSATVTLAF